MRVYLTPKLFYNFLIVMLIVVSVQSRNITKAQADNFIDALLNNRPETADFFDSSEIEIANRLGINYKNVDHKFLVTYDFDPEVKQKLLNGEWDFQITIENPDSIYSKIIFYIPQLELLKEFFSRNSKLISPVTFYTADWKRIESKHFCFVVSDTSLFNYTTGKIS